MAISYYTFGFCPFYTERTRRCVLVFNHITTDIRDPLHWLPRSAENRIQSVCPGVRVSAPPARGEPVVPRSRTTRDTAKDVLLFLV